MEQTRQSVVGTGQSRPILARKTDPATAHAAAVELVRSGKWSTLLGKLRSQCTSTQGRPRQNSPPFQDLTSTPLAEGSRMPRRNGSFGGPEQEMLRHGEQSTDLVANRPLSIS